MMSNSECVKIVNFLYRGFNMARMEDLTDTEEENHAEIIKEHDELKKRYPELIELLDAAIDEAVYSTAPGSDDEDEILEEAEAEVWYAREVSQADDLEASFGF